MCLSGFAFRSIGYRSQSLSGQICALPQGLGVQSGIRACRAPFFELAEDTPISPRFAEANASADVNAYPRHPRRDHIRAADR